MKIQKNNISRFWQALTLSMAITATALTTAALTTRAIAAPISPLWIKNNIHALLIYQQLYLDYQDQALDSPIQTTDRIEDFRRLIYEYADFVADIQTNKSLYAPYQQGEYPVLEERLANNPIELNEWFTDKKNYPDCPVMTDGTCDIFASVEQILQTGDKNQQALMENYQYLYNGYLPSLTSREGKINFITHNLMDSHLETLQKEALDQGFLVNGLVIGMGNIDGEFSDKFQLLDTRYQHHLNIYIYPLDEDNIRKDPKLFMKLDGLILPGAGDTYHTAGAETMEPFFLHQMDKSNMSKVEKLYQELYDLAQEYKLPVISTCAGHQHLALHQNGSLMKLRDDFDEKRDVRLLPGTLNHFMGLSLREQTEALNQCLLPDVNVLATVMHSYVVSDPGDNVITGGLTTTKPEGIIMAASWGGTITSFQFHPEYQFSLEHPNNPNTRIIESWVRSVSQFKAIKETGRREDFSHAMTLMTERLKQCHIAPEATLADNQFWFTGYRDETLALHQGVDALVTIWPHLTPEDVDFTFGPDSTFMIKGGKKAHGKTMTLHKASDDQSITVIFSSGDKKIF